MKHPQRHRRHPSGAIALLTIVTISAFTLAIITAVSVIATSLVSNATTHRATEQVFFAAESGLHDALYRIGINSNTTSYTTSVNGHDVVVTITPLGFRRQVRVAAHDTVSNVTRTVAITVATSSFAAGFDDAVMAGEGGFQMENNASVSGSTVHVNGNITGDNNSSITGDVFVSHGTPTTSIDNVNVVGNLYAHTIKNLTVTGDAHYALDPADLVNATVTGTKYPNSTDPEPTPFPIQNSDLPPLRASITAEGSTHVGDVTISDSSYNEANPFPYARVDGNLVFKESNVTVVLNKNLYVTGNVTFQKPNQVLRLATAMGDESRIVLADGKMDMKNNATVEGAPGHPKSFLMMLSANSEFTDESNPAIYASNNGVTAIFVAPNGMVRVYNGNTLHNATGYRIKIDQNAHVIYDPNLAFFVIPSSGSASAPQVDPTTWREL